MDAQPQAAESPTSVEQMPNILEILAGGFSEIADDAPMFI